jgi:RNA-directed DNA polymerase
MSTWHRIHGMACYRQVRSLQRRIVQAVQAGVWHKVKRLSSLSGHSCAARALAVKRVTENTGKKTSGVDGDLSRVNRSQWPAAFSGDGSMGKARCNGADFY